MMAFSSQVKFKEEVKENINIMIKIKSRTEIEKMRSEKKSNCALHDHDD